MYFVTERKNRKRSGIFEYSNMSLYVLNDYTPYTAGIILPNIQTEMDDSTYGGHKGRR